MIINNPAFRNSFQIQMNESYTFHKQVHDTLAYLEINIKLILNMYMILKLDR